MHTLIHRRRMETKKHNFQLRSIDTEIRKANAHQNMQRNTFLKNRTYKRNEWWNKDKHYREALRNAILTKGKHNNYLRSNYRSKSNEPSTPRTENTLQDFEKENTSSLALFKLSTFVKEKSIPLNASSLNDKNSNLSVRDNGKDVKTNDSKLPKIDKVDDDRLKFKIVLDRFLNNTPFLVESRKESSRNEDRKCLILEQINKERKSTLARDNRYDNLLGSLANFKI